MCAFIILTDRVPTSQMFSSVAKRARGREELAVRQRWERVRRIIAGASNGRQIGGGAAT